MTVTGLGIVELKNSIRSQPEVTFFAPLGGCSPND
jgi:hypothetical protein